MTKIAFSFDDGRMDNYIAAKEILEPKIFPASFNITTGYIMEDIKEMDKPSENKPMTIEQLKELSETNLFEIAGHGYTHDNEPDNLIKGVDGLRVLLKNNISMGIASPHSEFDMKNLDNFKKDCKDKNIVYLRISHRFLHNKKLRMIIRKINRFLHIPSLYAWIYKDTDVKNNDDFLIYSVPIIKDNKLNEVKYLIKKAIKEEKSYILMFHSILKPNEDFYNDLFSWDYNDFEELCDFLKKLEKENKLKICKTIEMVEKD